MKVPADNVKNCAKVPSDFRKIISKDFRFSSNYLFEDLNFVRVDLLS